MENLIVVFFDLFVVGWYYGMWLGGEVILDMLEVQGIEIFVLIESCVYFYKDCLVVLMDFFFDDMVWFGIVFNKKEEVEVFVVSWKLDLFEIDIVILDENRLWVFFYDLGIDKLFMVGWYVIMMVMIEVVGGMNVMSDMEISWGIMFWEVVVVVNLQFFVFFDYQDGFGVEGLMVFFKEYLIMFLIDVV